MDQTWRLSAALRVDTFLSLSIQFALCFVYFFIIYVFILSTLSTCNRNTNYCENANIFKYEISIKKYFHK